MCTVYKLPSKISGDSLNKSSSQMMVIYGSKDGKSSLASSIFGTFAILQNMEIYHEYPLTSSLRLMCMALGFIIVYEWKLKIHWIATG